MSQGWDEKAVFLGALARRASERDAFLRGACPDDASRKRVELLLLHHAQATSALPAGEATEPVGPAGIPEQIDEFKILGRLGEGGMGVVYLAEDTILGRKVALKVLARHLTGSEQALARFREEAKNAAALRHPVIVPVFKFVSSGRSHYLVSEYVDGPTLGELIERERVRRASTGQTQGTKEWHRQSAAIIAAIGDALDSTHRALIVHRDIKPSNILIDRERGPRLTDFGIAKHLVEEGGTTSTAVIGSCHYMSPEQASIVGAQIDSRSDIFSLGVVLFELLSLQRLFGGKTVAQVLNAVIHTEAPNPRSLDRSVPRDLAIVCLKAIEKHPARRYQTAAHMAADLRCFLDGLPILASPPSRIRRVALHARRHARSLAIAAVLLLALCTVGATRLYLGARRALLGQIVLPQAMAGARVTALRHQGPDQALGAPVVLGTAPFSAFLEPGMYRLTIKLPGGAVVEASSFIQPGTMDTVEVRPPAPEALASLVLVPNGTYPLGESDPEVQPHPRMRPRSEAVQSFRISVTEVSNAEYHEFVVATAAQSPECWASPYDPADDRLPVAHVSWDEANRYCRWRGLRLPTPSEWEAAATGPQRQRFPWGNAARPNLERIESKDNRAGYLGAARSVDGDPPDLRSPFGLHHMASNVMEYTEGVGDENTWGLVVMGRSWGSSPTRGLAQLATLSDRSKGSFDRGFRVATSNQQREDR